MLHLKWQSGINKMDLKLLKLVSVSTKEDAALSEILI